MKYFLILSLAVGVNVSHAGAIGDLDGSWLTLQCHNEDNTSAFSFSISSDNLDGVYQITDAIIKGELKKEMEYDIPLPEHPLVSLASRKGADFEVMLRYESGLMWDTYLKMKLTYRPEAYTVKINVTGDGGEYLDEEFQYQCRIGSYDFTYLKTERF